MYKLKEVNYEYCEYCKYWSSREGDESSVSLCDEIFVGLCDEIFQMQKKYNSAYNSHIYTDYDFHCNKFNQKLFSKRIGNLEVKLNESKELEMVRWHTDNETCIVLAFWVFSDRFWEMKFVANRPFLFKINIPSFWALAKEGQEYLENEL